MRHVKLMDEILLSASPPLLLCVDVLMNVCFESTCSAVTSCPFLCIYVRMFTCKLIRTYANCDFLGYYASSCDNLLPTFRDIVSVPTLWWDRWVFPEPSIRNYHYSLLKNSGERSSHFLCCNVRAYIYMSQLQTSYLCLHSHLDIFPSQLTRVYYFAGSWLFIFEHVLTF
jgi:hypothetical protein